MASNPADARAPEHAHGIYVHAPWCRVHCPYCAFNVMVAKDPPWRAWMTAVLRDHDRVAAAFPHAARSLYLGGGTPSLAPLDVLADLLAGLPRAADAELTLEVDPGTVDADGLRARLDLGVNRLSLGVQTFHPGHARRLGRGHSVREAETLLAQVVRLPLRSWSFDLMFALPGQTLAELDADLDRVIDLGPPHVSLYGLTFEPGTPFADRLAQGRLAAPDEDLWRAMYDRIVERLLAAGWQRYEVSNFARPGHRSRHNEATWRGGYYAGLGPGAHGYLPPGPDAPLGTRTLAHADLRTWLADPFEEVERLAPRTAAVDLLLSSVRHIDGLALSALQATGFHLDAARVDRLVAGGLLRRAPDGLRLTDTAFPLADGVTSALVDALLPSARARAGLAPPP